MSVPLPSLEVLNPDTPADMAVVPLALGHRDVRSAQLVSPLETHLTHRADIAGPCYTEFIRGIRFHHSSEIMSLYLRVSKSSLILDTSSVSVWDPWQQSGLTGRQPYPRFQLQNPDSILSKLGLLTQGYIFEKAKRFFW